MRRFLVSSTLDAGAGLVLRATDVDRPAAGIEPLSTQFHINHADPQSSVPTDAEKNAKPLEFGYYLQDLIAFAMAADKSGDHLAAARYYRAFAKAVPDESIAFQKLCESLQKAGRLDEAKAACREALGRPGIDVNDYVRYTSLVLARKGALTKDELDDVNEIVDHLRREPATRAAGIHLQCELAMHNADVPLLQQCSGELAALAPNESQDHLVPVGRGDAGGERGRGAPPGRARPRLGHEGGRLAEDGASDRGDERGDRWRDMKAGALLVTVRAARPAGAAGDHVAPPRRASACGAMGAVSPALETWPRRRRKPRRHLTARAAC